MNNLTAEAYENQYLHLLWKRQRLQWENYVVGAHHNLSLVDDEMFQLTESSYGHLALSSRKAQVIEAIVTRERVDKHPDVAQLRNQLDDWDNYTKDVSVAQDRDPVGFRLAMAQNMKPDVLQLMQVRNGVARDLGFPSYIELVLSTEELELGPLLTVLERYLEDNLATARKIIGEYALSWPTWFTDLGDIGHLGGVSNPTMLVTGFLQRIGLGQVLNRISIISKTQAIAGYAGILSVPDDIRILIRPVGSLASWLVLFHELGHATAHALNEEFGAYKTWTSVHDETMAEVIEHVAALLLLDKANQRAARALTVLETTRCAISALFEFALWEQPEEAESLYGQHYGQLGLEIASPEIWAVDSFRSIDPVYNHNYVIGAVVAERTSRLLSQKYGDDLQWWGEWLKQNFYADGRKRSLLEKVAVVGGFV